MKPDGRGPSRDADEPLLRVRGLRKSFGRLVAVDSLDFEVRRGEILGIAGPNGAGKSTVVNLLTRVPYGPEAGEVLLAGRPIHRASARTICHLGLARTFQAESVFATMSVYDNVRVAAVYGRARREPGESVDEVVRRSLDFVGLGVGDNHRASDLPLVAKKRLMLASALATSPSLLLLDEPASGLTEAEQHELAALARKINDAGVSLLVIEHVLPLLRALASRLLVLVSGRLLVEGEPASVLADERVRAAYVGTRV